MKSGKNYKDIGTSTEYWERKRDEHRWLCRTCGQWVKERIGKQCRDCRREHDEGIASLEHDPQT